MASFNFVLHDTRLIDYSLYFAINMILIFHNVSYNFHLLNVIVNDFQYIVILKPEDYKRQFGV